MPAQRRQEFLDDLRVMLRDLLTRYDDSEEDAFKLAVACYPEGEAS